MDSQLPPPEALSGWAPDPPDFRDWTLDSPQAGGLLSFASSFGDSQAAVNWRDYFQPSPFCENASAAVSACCSLVEYFRRRCEGDATQLSCEFLDQACAVLQGSRRVAPICLRSALKAMVLTGVPPARLVGVLSRENKSAVDAPACYLYAPAFRDLQYFRVNSPDPWRTLTRVKQLLHAGIPSVFGFSAPSSLSGDSRIDVRLNFDSIIGGTAAVIVGYDDRYRMSSAGAVCFQSMWGAGWGESGFGWLSYQHFHSRMVPDVWTVIKPAWLASLIADRGVREFAAP